LAYGSPRSDHDFDVALAYLSLTLDEKWATAAVPRLRKAEVTHRRANDICEPAALCDYRWTTPGVRPELLKAASLTDPHSVEH
jgi:hypothetical protein